MKHTSGTLYHVTDSTFVKKLKFITVSVAFLLCSNSADIKQCAIAWKGNSKEVGNNNLFMFPNYTVSTNTGFFNMFYHSVRLQMFI